MQYGVNDVPHVSLFIRSPAGGGYRIGEQDFLSKPQYEQGCATGEFLHVMFSLDQLIGERWNILRLIIYCPIPLNGS